MCEYIFDFVKNLVTTHKTSPLAGAEDSSACDVIKRTLPEDIQSVTVAQLQNLSELQIADLSLAQIGNMNLDQIDVLSLDKVSKFNSEQIDSLNKARQKLGLITLYPLSDTFRGSEYSTPSSHLGVPIINPTAVRFSPLVVEAINGLNNESDNPKPPGSPALSEVSDASSVGSDFRRYFANAPGTERPSELQDVAILAELGQRV